LLSIPLWLGPHGSENVFRVARVFMAIREANEQLCELYIKLQVAPSPSSPLSPTMPLWPNPTRVPTESTGPLPKLEYYAKVNRDNGAALLRIDENNERHAMYLARMMPSGQNVFVKFTPNYHQDAHRLLAEHVPPLAPALHFCGRVIGDMYMVVMEYIPQESGRSICSYSSFKDSLLPKSSPEVVKRDVSRALELLHGQGLAFGDLREPNILYMPGKDDGEDRVLLVDFDAVGLDGKGRYSACLNTEAHFCAEVTPGGIMKQEHDRKNLDELLERLRREVLEQFPEL